MALKTFKNTVKKHAELSELRWWIATRKPGFEDDFNALFIKIQEINQKYGLLPVSHPDYLSSVEKLGENTDAKRVDSILPLIEEFKAKHNLSLILGQGLPKDIEMMFAVATSPVRYHWKDNMFSHRYVDFRIDTLADLEIIKSHLIFNMQAIQKGRKERNIRMPDQEFRKLHLSKAEIYIKVFDMRSEKPPVPYEKIAITLQKEGFYKGLALKNAIDSTRKDFSLIFEEIYGVPYKKYDAKKFKSSGIKECSACKKRAQCRELCAPISYLLSLEEVKRQHVLGEKADAREQYKDTRPEEVLEDYDNI